MLVREWTRNEYNERMCDKADKSNTEVHLNRDGNRPITHGNEKVLMCPAIKVIKNLQKPLYVNFETPVLEILNSTVLTLGPGNSNTKAQNNDRSYKHYYS